LNQLTLISVRWEFSSVDITTSEPTLATDTLTL